MDYLGNDMINCICSYLSGNDVAALMCTSKYFNKAIDLHRIDSNIENIPSTGLVLMYTNNVVSLIANLIYNKLLNRIKILVYEKLDINDYFLYYRYEVCLGIDYSAYYGLVSWEERMGLHDYHKDLDVDKLTLLKGTLGSIVFLKPVPKLTIKDVDYEGGIPLVENSGFTRFTIKSGSLMDEFNDNMHWIEADLWRVSVIIKERGMLDPLCRFYDLVWAGYTRDFSNSSRVHIFHGMEIHDIKMTLGADVSQFLDVVRLFNTKIVNGIIFIDEGTDVSQFNIEELSSKFTIIKC